MVYLEALQRNSSGRSAYLATLLLLFSTVLCIAPSHSLADDAYIKSKTPVFFDVESTRALVYFVNDLFDGTAHVYLDSTAIGFLPRQTYTAASVAPGFRLIWGTSEARWVEFKPGWTYLLRLVKVGTLSHAWVTDNPGSIRVLVLDKQLTYVATRESERARLQAKVDSRYQDAIKRAGTELALPFSKRFHTLDLGGKSPATVRAER